MRRVWLTSLLLFLATFAVFHRVLFADFVQWDDDTSVYQNPHIQGLDWARLQWMFTDVSYALRYKPLTWLTYTLIYQAVGLKPFGYHLVNLLLHCCNTVLVFLVIRRLLAVAAPARGPDERRMEATLPSAVGALLWAINPLRVEPVARVTDLTYCLHFAFLLVSLWCYLRACGGPAGGRGQRPLYWCSVTAFALAMISYPFAFAYGVLLLVLDWYPLKRFKACAGCWRDANARKVLLEKIPFLLLGGVMWITILGRLNPTGAWAIYQPDSSSTLFMRGMQALYVWAYYAWKPWLPFHLSPVYTTLVNFNPNTWPFWLSAAFVIGATVLLVGRRNQWPWALALWLSHLVLLLPALGLTERPHYASDRYDYLPGLLWAIAIAAVLWHLGSRPRLRLAGMACALALGLLWGTLSARQTRVWHDSAALFTHTLRELGNNFYAADIHWRLGSWFARQGKTDAAVRHYQASLQVYPLPTTYAAFGLLMETNGHPEAALTNYQGLLQLTSDPSVLAKMGRLLCQLGRSREAISSYRTALIAFPNLVPVLNSLAWTLASDPDPANRDGAEAVRLAERACALTDSQVPAVVETLAAAYAEAGRFSEAVATAEKARELALAAGQRDVADRNRERLELYRSGRAYHQPPPRPPAGSGPAP